MHWFRKIKTTILLKCHFFESSKSVYSPEPFTQYWQYVETVHTRADMGKLRPEGQVRHVQFSYSALQTLVQSMVKTGKKGKNACLSCDLILFLIIFMQLTTYHVL